MTPGYHVDGPDVPWGEVIDLPPPIGRAPARTVKVQLLTMLTVAPQANGWRMTAIEKVTGEVGDSMLLTTSASSSVVLAFVVMDLAVIVQAFKQCMCWPRAGTWIWIICRGPEVVTVFFVDNLVLLKY